MSTNAENFDWKFYATYYTDLKSAGIDSEKKAWDHYQQHGRKERRLANAESLDAVTRQAIHVALESGEAVAIAKEINFFELPDGYWDHLVDFGHIVEGMTVLELGCGRGQFMKICEQHLGESGRYYGCDLDRKNVEWCRGQFGKGHFHSISSSHSHHSSRRSLPYESGKFDCVFAPYFFMKLTAEETRHYLNEVSRVLKVGGRCLFSCLLWNPVIETLSKTGRNQLKVVENLGEYLQIENTDRSRATAYPESMMIQWHENVKLPIMKILYGSWSGNVSENQYQDILCAQRIK